MQPSAKQSLHVIGKEFNLVSKQEGSCQITPLVLEAQWFSLAQFLVLLGAVEICWNLISF